NEYSYVIDAVKEAVEIGRQAEIPVLISHHKIGGKNNLGKSIDTLKLIDEANKEGIEVSLDQYPYSASCTYLSIHIPPEYHEGGNERLIQRLKNKNTLDNIKKRMLNENGAWENPAKLIGFENVLIIAADKTPEIVGKTIGDFAKKHNLDPYEVMFKVLVDNDANVLAANFGFNEEDIENIMRYPYTMIGTDGILAGEGKIIHPRATATFPRVLGRYVRERGVIRLEEAIRKMTSLPAQKARLKNKGLIKEGFDADLVIFDPDQIIDTATYTDPYSKNIGFKYVIVNGVISMIDNEFTGSSAGKVIRLKR
ncbi:MAG TPA: amidohydrolase family protein, partial [Thermoanaerobacterales bacterium]|nr:amidohydrolase family protein [Thermoanaerobacterales bacterium]